MKGNRRRRSTWTGFSHPQGPEDPPVAYRAANVIFSQGDAANTVLYSQKGAVKLRVVEHRSRDRHRGARTWRLLR